MAKRHKLTVDVLDTIYENFPNESVNGKTVRQVVEMGTRRAENGKCLIPVPIKGVICLTTGQKKHSVDIRATIKLPDGRRVALQVITWMIANDRSVREDRVTNHVLCNSWCVEADHLSEDTQSRDRHMGWARRRKSGPAKRLPRELRFKLMVLYVLGIPATQLAPFYDIGPSTISNWIRENRRSERSRILVEEVYAYLYAYGYDLEFGQILKRKSAPRDNETTAKLVQIMEEEGKEPIDDTVIIMKPGSVLDPSKAVG